MVVVVLLIVMMGITDSVNEVFFLACCNLSALFFVVVRSVNLNFDRPFGSQKLQLFRNRFSPLFQELATRPTTALNTAGTATSK